MSVGGCEDADVRALEHSSMKVPYEFLNKTFRVAQRTVDREVSQASHVLNLVDAELEKENRAESSHLAEAVQQLIVKLKQLKEKAEKSCDDEIDAVDIFQRRIDYLKVSSDPLKSEAEKSEWRKERVDRLISDYLLRAGYYESAALCAQQSRVGYMTNLSVFLTAREVEESLEAGKVDKCLEWCQDNKSKLRRLHSRLELLVREQEFVELIRGGEKAAAIDYAKKWFAGQDESVWRTSDDGDDTLQTLMGLLAFPEHGELPGRYRRLLSAERWGRLIGQFRHDNYRLYQLSHQSVFSACLQTGLAALKTPHCAAGASANCPVCQERVRPLAAGAHIPYAHVHQSHLVCALSGRPLDENNPPLMLPNGMVYGDVALREMAERQRGLIICPRTGLTCSADELARVYVL